MRNILAVATFCALLFSALPAMAQSDESEWVGSFNLTYGQRNLDSGFWSPVETQDSVGGFFNFGKKEWPAHILVGVSTSVQEKTGITAGGTTFVATGETRELDLGAIVALDEGIARPFVGAGAAMVTAVGKGTTVATSLTTEEDDVGFGYFLMGGINFRVFETFNIGAVVKLVNGTDVTLFNESGDANFLDYSLFVGWTF